MLEEQMLLNDKTTACQLHATLHRRQIDISLRIVLHCRTQLGWTFRGSSYFQLILHANKEKRLARARENIDMDCDNVIWTDKCSVQLETHRQFCCRKHSEPPRNKPKYVLVLDELYVLLTKHKGDKYINVHSFNTGMFMYVY